MPDEKLITVQCLGTSHSLDTGISITFRKLKIFYKQQNHKNICKIPKLPKIHKISPHNLTSKFDPELDSNNSLTIPNQRFFSKVATSRAALVRERQKLLEQTEKYQRQLILKQTSNNEENRNSTTPSRHFLEKLNSYELPSMLSTGISTKPLHGLNMNLISLNDPGYRPYTKPYVIESIKREDLKLRSAELDTVENCFSGEYLDDNGISVSNDGPFWPPGVNPCAGLPDGIAGYDDFERVELYQESYVQEKGHDEMIIQTDKHDRNETHSKVYTAKYQDSWNKNAQDSNSSPTFEYWKTGRHIVFDTEKRTETVLTDDTLRFESKFESGNLRQVKRVGPQAYELILSTDRFTQRHTQWFFFSISNIKYKNYKFFIINLHKKDSLYNFGMQPVVYYRNKWQRFGKPVKYCPYSPASLYGGAYATCNNQFLNSEKTYHALILEIGPFNRKPMKDERVFVGHCYPYTYTNLRRHVQALSKIPRIDQILRVETLCRTIAGNNCYILTISNFVEADKSMYATDLNSNSTSDLNTDTTSKSDNFLPASERKIAIITARVHPGESQASWMAHGLIKFLLSDAPIAIMLRNKFVFKIVPMINIDGVIVGNYRTSLAAKDLNRNYRYPRQQIFPVIWYVKEIIRQNKRAGRDILFYVDLHGHSRKKSSFMYGCHENLYQTPEEGLDEFHERKLNHMLQQRSLPWLLGQRAKTLFNFDYCAFSMKRSKESTGRVVMYKEFGIKNSLTYEATFAGTSVDVESGKQRQFNQKDFMDMGKSLCEAFYDYDRKMFEMDKKNAVFEQIATRLKMQIAQKNGEEAEFENSEGQTRASRDQDSIYSKYSNKSSENILVKIPATPGFKSNSSGSMGRCLSILGENLNEIFDVGDDSEEETKGSKKGAKKRSKKKKDSDDGDDSDSESEPELILNFDGDSKKNKKPEKKKSDKKKKSKKKQATKEPLKIEESTKNNLKNGKLRETKSEQDVLRKKTSPEPGWENPYANRNGNGQAFFTNERNKRKKSAKEVYKVEQPEKSIYHPSQYRPETNEREESDFKNLKMEETETKLLGMNQFRFPNFERNNNGKMKTAAKNSVGNHQSSIGNPLTSQPRTIESTLEHSSTNLGGFYPKMFKTDTDPATKISRRRRTLHGENEVDAFEYIGGL